MAIQRLPIFPISNKGRSEVADPTQSFNMYLTKDRVTGETYAKPTAGSLQTIEIDTGSSTDTGRPGGLQVFGDQMYAVLGSSFYRITSNLVASLIGNIATTTGTVSMAFNGRQVILVDGVNGWIYDVVASTFTVIPPVNFTRPPTSVTYQDGFFIVSDAQSKVFQVSAVDDGLTWDLTNIERKEAQPDNLISVISLNQRLLLIGDVSTETWYITTNTGGNPFPFRRDNNLLYNYGIFSSASLAVGHHISETEGSRGAAFWIAKDLDGSPSVIMTDGSTPQKVSTPHIEYQLQELARNFDISDFRGALYKEDGHIFYQITSSNANVTFVYDVLTGQWHQKDIYNEQHHPLMSVASFDNRIYFTKDEDSNIYELSADYSDDDGKSFAKRIIMLPNINTAFSFIRIKEIEYYFQSGEGKSLLPALAQASPYLTGAIPEARLEVSKDGGHLYGYRKQASIGAIGRTKTRVRFRQLGRVESNRLVLKLRMPDRVPYFLLNGYISFEVMK